jgi:uncharacterized protein (TIGR04255 family)
VAELNPQHNYKILLGLIYDRVTKEYPHHEELPAASVPDELAGHIVQHRFRKSENNWPLIQIGPGLVTLNDTNNYTWKGFQKKPTNYYRHCLERTQTKRTYNL